MKSNLLVVGLSWVLLLAGCVTMDKAGAQKSEAPAPVRPSLEAQVRAKMAAGDQCRLRKQYEKAYILYSEAVQLNEDFRVHRQLVLLQSQVLLDMEKHSAALAVLSPLPELPGTLWDCKKLAMASRILSKMKTKPEYVESLMEVALDNQISEPGTLSFKAAGYAELGRIYVTNRKTSRAITCFVYAAELYDRLGNEEQAKNCRNIAEYLR